MQPFEARTGDDRRGRNVGGRSAPRNAAGRCRGFELATQARVASGPAAA
jgi:hypothetical protein